MPKHLDEATFLAHLAAFAAKPTPDAATALAAEDDPRALPALVEAMTDTMEGPDVVRYREAVRAVATVPVLSAYIAQDIEHRRVAAHALTARNPEHAALIGRCLKDEDDQTRAIARRALRSWVACPQVHDLFVESLQHPDARVRLLAAEGLGKLGTPADLPPLQAALDQEADDKTRDRLAWAVEKLENAEDA